MALTTKLKCPACGTPMNHHSNKLVYCGSSSHEAPANEPGEIVEFHSCPACGSSGTRAG